MTTTGTHANGTARLVDMANDIAAYFVSDPDEAGALELFVLHLQRFWEPRMRQKIVAFQRGGGEGLSPLAMRAIVELSHRMGEDPPPPFPEGGGDAG